MKSILEYLQSGHITKQTITKSSDLQPGDYVKASWDNGKSESSVLGKFKEIKEGPSLSGNVQQVIYYFAIHNTLLAENEIHICGRTKTEEYSNAKYTEPTDTERKLLNKIADTLSYYPKIWDAMDDDKEKKIGKVLNNGKIEIYNF